MAITTRYATNTALQYNEVDLTDFLINPSIGSRRFLTEAEQTRILRATETSALYFITDTSGTFYSARYRWYDSGGTLLNEYILSLSSAGVHNSIPVDWTSFYVPSGAVKLTVAIIGATNQFANGQFEIGSGNLFTSWTLTQPSRTNYLLQSQNYENATWGKDATTVTDNAITAPSIATKADKITPNATNAYHAIAQGSITIPAGTNTIWTLAKYDGYRYLFCYDQFNNFYRVVFDVLNGAVQNSIVGTGEMIELEDGWYLCKITFNYTSGTIVPTIITTPNTTDAAFLADGVNGVYLSQSQLEDGSFATPTIRTTNATVTTSTGEFLQDVSGGFEGTRCIRMWADAAATTLLNQAVSLVSGTNYTIRFRAKADRLGGNDSINIVVGATDIGDTAITTDWAWYTDTFTASATASTGIFFSYINDDVYGFASFDDVSISPTSPSLLSEERTYLLEDSCVSYECELNWLNKLGGRDTWVMTGFPTETVDVKRNNEIEYSARTNYTSPNRIYGYRENKSRKSVTLTHQCKDRATAEWLKSELIDTIDLMVLTDGIYRPADVVASSIVTSNTFSQDFTVRVTLRYAYDINVQTR